MPDSTRQPVLKLGFVFVAAWLLLALLRGAGLAVALCWAREHEMEHMLSGALIGRVGPLLLVVAANLAVGAAEFVIATAWLVRKLWHSRASLWDGMGVLVFPVAAVLPLLLPGHDGERMYLDRHRAELERAVLTGEKPDDWDVWKDGERTILMIGPWGITDAYFLIHDPNPGGELSDEEFTTYSFQRYRRSIRHVEGPWHSISLCRGLRSRAVCAAFGPLIGAGGSANVRGLRSRGE